MILELVLILLIIFCGAYILVNYETFNAESGSSSAWGWNTGPGYGDGYGTGYGLYGVWPSSDPRGPWKWYMWGRKPKNIISPYTPVPQYDYLTAAPLSKFNSNYTFTLCNTGIAINGFPNPTMQWDQGRPLYLHVRLVDAAGQSQALVFLDENYEPITPEIVDQTVQIEFPPGMYKYVYYVINDNAPENGGGIIYLNAIQ